MEFQGSVVRARFTGRSKPTPGPDDGHWFQRAHQELFHKLVQSYPRELRYRLPDGSFTVDIPPQRWVELEFEAWDYARELKKRFFERGKRGQITGFSRKSRKRLIEMCARLRDDVEGLFLTLTYRANYQDARGAKKHLDLMLRWLRYHRPGCTVIWRMEPQDRGAIHFHLLILGTTWIAVRGIRTQWRGLIGELGGNVDVERIHNRRKAMVYVAKYIAKPVEQSRPDQPGEVLAATAQAGVSDPVASRQDEPGAGGAATVDPLGPVAPEAQALRLDYLPYSENGETVPAGGVEQDDEEAAAALPWVGRFWGVVGRKFTPFADKVHFEFVGSPAALLDFRRAARRFRPGLFRRSALNGFTLFVQDVQRWLRLWYCCEQGQNLKAHVISGEQMAFQVARGGPSISYAPGPGRVNV